MAEGEEAVDGGDAGEGDKRRARKRTWDHNRGWGIGGLTLGDGDGDRADRFGLSVPKPRSHGCAPARFRLYDCDLTTDGRRTEDLDVIPKSVRVFSQKKSNMGLSESSDLFAY